MFSWLRSFLTEIFGNFWGNLASVILSVLMGPLCFFLFGPLFKLSGYIIDYILRQLTPHLGDVGLVTDGVLAWLIETMRLQESVTAFATFMVLSFTIGLLKKVF